MQPRYVPSAVPVDLADLNQWVVWLYDAKNRKIPYQVNGQPAASNDPTTWTDLGTALSLLKEKERLAGVGFVFHSDDPYCGVDLDDCLEDGLLKPWAVDIVRRFGETYGEVSPSGTGLKFWCRGFIETGRKFPYHDGAIEIYSSGRYFTFTGNRWPTATLEIADCQATVEWLATLAPQSQSSSFSLPQEIKKGVQHNTLISYAASLWAKNLDPDEVRQLTIAASKRCQEVPPEKNALAIADWIIKHKKRGHSDKIKAKLNGDTPKDYTFEGADTEPPPPEDNDDEKVISYVPWPQPLADFAFHGPLGDLCKIIEPHTEADIAAVLFQALAMIGNMIGRGIHWTAESTPHYCNEFICLVGATAKGRKGSSFGQVNSVLKRIDQDWAKYRVKSGLSSGEGLIYHIRDEMREMKTIKGVTKEVVTDAGEKDKRMLVVEEEFSSALKVMAREGNTLSGVLRQAWDSPAVLAPMTKNNRITASDPHVSIIGHITRDELLKSLKAVENTNGGTNRFLWCCAKRSKSLPFGGNPAGEALMAVYQRLDQAVGWAQMNPGLIGFDSEAAEMWSIVYDELGDIPGGAIGGILSRAEPHVRRIATIFAAMDMSLVVNADHLTAALEIWRYSRDSVRWIFGSQSVSEQETLSDRIFEIVKASPEGCMRSEIAAKLGGKSVKKTDLEFHLGVLLNKGSIRMAMEKRKRNACPYYYQA